MLRHATSGPLPRHYQRGLPFALGGPPSTTPADARLREALTSLQGRAADGEPERGLALLAAAARAGDPAATALLGAIRWNTRGGEEEGVALLQRAADAGHAGALHLLGLARFHGRGVEQDLRAARALQQQAAERGVVDAQFELSLLLSQGIGGPRDARAAARWERRAAEAGHPRACLNRGARLASARRPDHAGAIAWYERAAAGGSAEAAARLCRMHLAGQGVPRDERAARRWFERAAALGDDGASSEQE